MGGDERTEGGRVGERQLESRRREASLSYLSASDINIRRKRHVRGVCMTSLLNPSSFDRAEHMSSYDLTHTHTR
jgi:hypothetical protein